MAKFEVAFNMIGKVRDSARIEQFLEQHRIDYTIRKDENGIDHEYGFLAGGNGSSEPLTVVNTESLPFDEARNVLPIKFTMSDGSMKMVDINPAEVYRIKPAPDNLKEMSVSSVKDDMESFEFNTALINDFIQFLNPYKLDPMAQEILLDALGKILDSCGEIRNGKADAEELNRLNAMLNKGGGNLTTEPEGDE